MGPIDFSPVFDMMFVGFGAIAGLLLSLILWPIVGLGWWTFAIPAALGVIAPIVMRIIERGYL